MADSQYDAQTRIQVLLEYLHEREMDLEDLAEQVCFLVLPSYCDV